MRPFFWLSDKELAALIDALSPSVVPGSFKLLRWARREQASR